MSTWYSIENLQKAWGYARNDAKDNFVFDVINYEDFKLNLDLLLSSLHSRIRDGQYCPHQLIQIDVPKNEHSARPGSTPHLVDLIVLYAIAQQLAYLLDVHLSDSVFAYRLNPRAGQSREHLFAPREETSQGEEIIVDIEVATEETEDDIGPEFPYNWFPMWKEFHDGTRLASESYKHAAVTDITAYFENISLAILREILKEHLDKENRELIDRLFRILEFWDWSPSGPLPTGIGLPQGNDVSSFLSNMYLIDLDKEMLKIVDEDTSKYYRYVDDVKLFTSDRNEALIALAKFETVLRSLNLNVQSAKTKILSSDEVFDSDEELWLLRLSNDAEDRVDSAREFFLTIVLSEETAFSIEDWQRPFVRCLTVLRQGNDPIALEVALRLFLSNPSSRLLNKTFIYLRNFVSTHSFSQELSDRLSEDRFTFPYHRAILFRLGAYFRDEGCLLKEISLQETVNDQAHWYSRMSALFCLNSFDLDGTDLAQVNQIVLTESNPQILRGAYITLAQHSGDELRYVLERVSLPDSPYQDFLRRYMVRLVRSAELGSNQISRVRNSSLNAPTFIHNLHKIDLLKANSGGNNRALFSQLIDSKIEECDGNTWPRLLSRFSGIRDKFVESP